nr:MAG TPA: baseplate wedge protein [Herelleviridae sp.]
MALENKWIRYIDRTYQQIKERVLTDMQVLVPEITDHTESNPYVNMLSVWAGIAEMLGYYIDNSAREAHLSQARLYWSGVKIANSYDYRIHSYLASTADVTFRLNKLANSDILIPAGTEIQNEAGIRFFTTQDVTIANGQKEITTTAKQYTPVSEINIGVSNGQASQVFEIDDNVLDNTCVVKVGTEIYLGRDTFAFSLNKDKHFVQSVSVDKKPIIKFGDGINGMIPPSGSAITVEYQRTEGENGNTGAFTLTKLISNVSLPATYKLEVFNKERSSGGSGVETLEQLQRRIPKSIRTLQRAVTEQDFIDITELKTGVAKAGVTYSCGKPVNIYIVPDGGGVATSDLITETQKWVDERRIITVQAKVQRAGEIRILFNISLNVLPAYNRALVVQKVKENIANFVSFKHQEIAGEVQLSDIYQTIENTEGVKNSTINVMKPRPYARPINNQHALNWVVNIKEDSSSTQIWQIKMVTATTYEVFKGGQVLGQYELGITYNLPNLEIQVLTGLYQVGDIWEFYTYPSFGTIDVVEPSLPVSLIEDITITANGGL